MKFKLVKIFIAGVPLILAACGGGNATNVSNIGLKQDDTLISDKTISEIAQGLETGQAFHACMLMYKVGDFGCGSRI